MLFVTQDMPTACTPLLADHLARIGAWVCVEARDGAIAFPGGISIAPGNRHLPLAGSKSRPAMQVSNGPQETFCRPSVDPRN
jgi:two-component system chemotaxis response regulator CheB